MQFNKILNQAAEYASVKSIVHHKHSCFILKGKKIITKGFNHHRNVYSFENRIHTTSTHAEMDAINKLRKNVLKDPRKFNRKIKHFTLISVREKLNLNSIPCMYCTESIKKFGIRKVLFINEDGHLIKQCSKHLQNNHTSGPQKDLCKRLVNCS
jgi:deoxycytidylate deaminase